MPRIRVSLTTFFMLSLLCWLASTNVAMSQPQIVEEQPLNFGTLAIAANASVSRFTYPYTGLNISIEGQFVLVASGTPGRYRLTGFPAYTQLSVSLDNTSLTAGGSGMPEPLSVDNYDHAQLTTNAQGEAELVLGARLSTSGNGGGYVDGAYSGSTVLRVDYWQPDVKAYVFNIKAIDLEAQLRSTLSITQEQPLHFGTLFAYSSATDQAVLNLSPSGSYSISEPGDTRLVALVKPEQGVLRVSGAAPYYALSITPQVADVLLRHTASPGTSPHFILSSLVTSPEGVAIVGASGELLITVGGTLKTEVTATPRVYPSGQYEGTYQLTVSY